MSNPNPPYLLDKAESIRLAAALQDLPETVICSSQLRHGRAWAAVIGTPEQFRAAIVEDRGQPGEPMLFGDDVAAMVTLVQSWPNWFCVNVAAEIAPELTEKLSALYGRTPHLLEDVHHLLERPAPQFNHLSVRRILPPDLAHLAQAPKEINSEQLPLILRKMVAFGAFIDGQWVAIAQNYARSTLFGDIGVFTLPEFRRRGFAAAAAAGVAAFLQSEQIIPVWSCGRTNNASMQLAAKLSFAEQFHRVYIIFKKS